jgi:tetratricopeptide (TPR) repeat protein
MIPLDALSVAAAIVQLVDFAAHYGNRMYTFTKEHLELPESLRLIQNRLGLLKDSLERTGEHIKANPDEYPPSSLLQLSIFTQDLQSRCQKLNNILDKYLPLDDAPKLDKIKKGFESIGNDKAVKSLAGEISNDVHSLILFLVTPKGPNSGTDRLLHLEGRFFTNVPQRLVYGFVGQDGLLSDIKEHFEANSEDEPRILLLQGMGGIGKTQAALEYCRQMKRAKQYSAILWIDATTKASVIQSFETISEVLKSTGQIFPDPESRIQFVKSILAGWEKKWMLVFDNYDNPDSFRIQEYFPTSQNGNILITTRSPEIYRIGRMIEMEAMSEDDSLSLLYKRIEIPATDKNRHHGVTIVRRLGYLPLAIDQTGAYIRERKSTLSLEEFPHHYDKYMEEIMKATPKLWEYLDSAGVGNENAKSVFTTWNMSYALLDDSRNNRSTEIGLLNCFAFFDEKDISEQMFSDFFNNIDESQWPVWLPNFADNDGAWSQKMFKDKILILKRYSLISSFNESERDGFLHVSIHPLVKDWIKLRQTKELSCTNFSLASKILCCWRIQPFWEFFSLNIFETYSSPFRPAKANDEPFQAHASIWQRNFKEDMQKLKPSFLAVKDTSQKLCVELCFAKILVPATELWLFEWLWEACGDVDTDEKLTKHICGAETLEYLITMQNIVEAEVKSRFIVKYWEARLDDTSLILSSARLQLCYVLDRVKGIQPWRQLDLFEEIESTCRRNLSNSSGIGQPFEILQDSWLFELGNVLFNSEDEPKFLEGRRLMQKLISRVISKPHTTTKLDFRILEGLPRFCDSWEDADNISQLCLTNMETRYGNDSPLITHALLQRINVLLSMGNIIEAERLCLECVRRVQSSTPHDGIHLNTYELMARVYDKQLDSQQALLFYGKAFQCLQSSSDEKPLMSNDGVRLLLRLGDSLREADRYEDSVRVLRLRLDICREVDRVTDIVQTYQGLGRTFEAERKFQLALEMYDKCYQYFQGPQKDEQPKRVNSNFEQEREYLKNKIGVSYRFGIVLSRAVVFAKLNDFELVDRDFRTCIASFKAISNISKRDREYVVDGVLKLSTWMNDEDGIPLDLAFKYAQWALEQSRTGLGSDHALVTKCLDKISYYTRKRDEALSDTTVSKDRELSPPDLSPHRKKRHFFAQFLRIHNKPDL